MTTFDEPWLTIVAELNMLKEAVAALMAQARQESLAQVNDTMIARFEHHYNLLQNTGQSSNPSGEVPPPPQI